jgi:hypothetical protein
MRRQIAGEHKNPQMRWQRFERLPNLAARKQTKQQKENQGATTVMQERLKRGARPIFFRGSRVGWRIHGKCSTHYAVRRFTRQALEKRLQSDK